MQQARREIGVVVIGRNEAKHLRQCLESVLKQTWRIVYIDSGSTDESVSIAQSLSIHTIELDESRPYSAARGRNAGLEYFSHEFPDIEFVQVLDGDCVLIGRWLEEALLQIQGNERTAVVCGRRRERYPAASPYNQLCDMEWNTPVGETDECGGDALIRIEAFREVGGYDPAMINTGEEPEFCLRLRHRGWQIARIESEMTVHDIQMTRFSQWWKRCQRCGYAYAQSMAMHGKSKERFRVRRVLSAIRFAALLPLTVISTLWLTSGFSLLLLADYAVLWHKVRALRLRMGEPSNLANLYATFCTLQKFPVFTGIVHFWLDYLARRSVHPIEYKVSPHPGMVNSEMTSQIRSH